MGNVRFFTSWDKNRILHWLDVAGRWVVGLVFLIAAVPKTLDLERFSGVVGAYGILPDAFVAPVALLLPIIEIVLAVGLIFGSRICLVGILGLLCFFVAILGYAILAGLDIDCGCFGPEDPESYAFKGLRGAVFRDLLMMLPLVFSLWMHSKLYYKKLQMRRSSL